MIPRHSRWLWLGFLVSLISTLVASQAGSSLVVKVVRVVDGDTIEVCCVGGKREKVRYIGINTPEMHHPTKGFDATGGKGGM